VAVGLLGRSGEGRRNICGRAPWIALRHPLDQHRVGACCREGGGGLWGKTGLNCLPGVASAHLFGLTRLLLLLLMIMIIEDRRIKI
jgi:hypothetical protein